MKIAEMSVEFIDSMGSDLSVVNAARVSFHKESNWLKGDMNCNFGEPYWDNELFLLDDRDQKLIKYLATHNHWTPFAHAFLSFRIKAPIFVARQLVKHQVGLAWNEVSRRYVDEEPEFWFPTGWRGKAENVKQGSSHDVVPLASVNTDYICPRTLVDFCLETYNGMLKDGVAPEQARMILPLNSMTEWIWSGSLAAFARVCKLRLDPHAQEETREIAVKIVKQVPEQFKYSWSALIDRTE